MPHAENVVVFLRPHPTHDTHSSLPLIGVESDYVSLLKRHPLNHDRGEDSSSNLQRLHLVSVCPFTDKLFMER